MMYRWENVLAFGNPGRGKTQLVFTIGQAPVRQGRKDYFSTCGLLCRNFFWLKGISSFLRC